MPSLGGGELLLLVLLALFAYGTVYGGIVAYRNRDGGWLAGIILGWFVGIGGLIGIIYLLTHRQRTA